MFVAILFVISCAAVHGQAPYPYRGQDYRYNAPYNNPYYEGPPRPYSFQYNALLDDGVGQSSRTENGDGAGRVQGSYTLNNDEGHFRVVEYVADEGGFRATIRTNEPGTESKNPADVVIQSEAVPAAYGPYQYTPRARRPYYNNAVVDPTAPINNALVDPVVDPAMPLRAPVRAPFRSNAYQGRNYLNRAASRYGARPRYPY